MGYTAEESHALQVATQQTWQAAVERLTAAGGYNWQMFGNGDGSGSAGPPQDRAGCSVWMRRYCAPAMQRRPLMMSAGGGNISLASFLIVRPPYVI